MQNDIENIYLKKSAEVIEINYDKLFVVQLSNLMPFLKPLLKIIVRCYLKFVQTIRRKMPLINRFVEELAPFWIINQAQEIVNYRQSNANEQKRVDLLQMMMDAKISNEKDKIVRWKQNINTSF